jgi:hypothetical protein
MIDRVLAPGDLALESPSKRQVSSRSKAQPSRHLRPWQQG